MISLGNTVSTDLATIAIGNVFVVRNKWSGDKIAHTIGLRIAPNSKGPAFLWFAKDKVPVRHQVGPTEPILDIGKLAIRIPDLLNSVTATVSEGKAGNLALLGQKKYVIVTAEVGELWIDLDTGVASAAQGQGKPEPWFVTHWQMGIEDSRGNFECLSEIRRPVTPQDKPSGNRPEYSQT